MTREEIILIADFLDYRIVQNDYGKIFIGHMDMLFDNKEMGITKKEYIKLFNNGEYDAWFTHEDAVDFDTDYRELMSIVEEITNNGYEFNIAYDKVTITGVTTFIEGFGDTLIDKIYNCCLDFIKSHHSVSNKNKKLLKQIAQ